MGLLVSSAFRRHHLHFVLLKFLRSVGEPFLCPGLHSPRAPSGTGVNTGQRPPPEAARSGVDDREHSATLDQVGFATVMPAHDVSTDCWKERHEIDDTAGRGGLNEPRGAHHWHAKLRVASLYSVGPILGPDHEAIIRFGGEAPRRRAHSNERFDDHVPARVTTTSDRDRPARQGGIRRACRNSVFCTRYFAQQSGCWPQHDTVRNFTGGDHAPEGDQQLTGEGDDHLRLACAIRSLGPAAEPLSQSAVLLKQ